MEKSKMGRKMAKDAQTERARRTQFRRMLIDQAEQMTKLSERLSDEGVPLEREELELIRMAMMPEMTARMAEIRTHFLADNLLDAHRGMEGLYAFMCLYD